MAGSSWRFVEVHKDNLKIVQGCGEALQMYHGELLASSNCNRKLLLLSASRAQEVSVTHAIFIAEKDHREANVILVAFQHAHPSLKSLNVVGDLAVGLDLFRQGSPIVPLIDCAAVQGVIKRSCTITIM